MSHVRRQRRRRRRVIFMNCLSRYTLVVTQWASNWKKKSQKCFIRELRQLFTVAKSQLFVDSLNLFVNKSQLFVFDNISYLLTLLIQWKGQILQVKQN